MATTYLSRTPSSTGSTQTGTFSAWIKKSSTATTNRIFAGFIDSNNFTTIYFRSVIDEITINHQDGGANTIDKKTTASFRDVNGWYHIVVAFDLSNGTAEDRIKLYVNGTRITSFSPNTNPGSSDTIDINSTSASVLVGYMDGTYFNGSMAHVHWIDGTVYAASDFGETDATTGIWKPKTAPSVTYGTNGFFLKFENSGAFGTDSSGNANNFTVNGNLTQTEDTPSNVFATYNSLIATKGQTFSNGNLSVATTTTNVVGGFSTIGVSKGKYYAEFKITAGSTDRGVVGIADNPSEQDRNNTIIGSSTYSYSYYGETGYKVNNSSGSAYGDTYTLGDIVGVALDLDNNYIYFSKNGTWQNSGDPTSGSSGTGAAYNITAASGTGTGFYHIGVGDDSGTYAHTIAANFGNGYFGTTAVSSATTDESGLGTFEYTVPTGYYALCTKNINQQEYS